MKLNDAEVYYVRSRTPARCPLCTSEDLCVADYLFALVQIDRNCAVGKEAIRPVAIVACNACGFEMHFNALHLGLLSPDVMKRLPADGAGEGDRLNFAVSFNLFPLKPDGDS
jgi:hypothetical protein